MTEAWRTLAKCLHLDSGLFFPRQESQAEKDIVGFCRGSKDGFECPVKNECLVFALKHNLDHGVWGGTTEVERRKIRRHKIKVDEFI